VPAGAGRRVGSIGRAAVGECLADGPTTSPIATTRWSLRGRLFAEEKIEISPSLRVTASGLRRGPGSRVRPTAPDVVTARFAIPPVTDASFRVHDAFAELTIGRLDLRPASPAWSGDGSTRFSRPTSSIPLDASRFFFEGRSEARLPVALIRGSLYLSDRASIEAVYVPVFPSRPLRSAR
jgi:hypothetical protein